MTWTYSLADLATSTKDQVRLLIGDTNSATPQLQDEEINFFILIRPSAYGAASAACDALASTYGQLADQSEGDTRISYSQISAAFSRRASEYDGKAAIYGGGLPYAGGMLVADKVNNDEDTDLVGPQFTIGMDDNFIPVGPAGPETGTTASAEGSDD